MLNIKQQLYTDIVAYCKLNNIVDIDKFCTDLLEKAFVAEKYGTRPQITDNKIVDKKIVEKSENAVSLQPNLIEAQKQEEEPKKIFKKLNLNDDYQIYDNI